MLVCVECWCVSHIDNGWLAYVAEDPDDKEGPIAGTYCPPCAARRFDAKPRLREYT
jgi:hypothetical protein